MRARARRNNAGPGPEESQMQTVLPEEFKRGMLLLLDNMPHYLEDFHTSGTAQTRHKLHVRVRNLKTGRVFDRTFAENERVPVGQLEHRMVQFSYKQGDTYAFLDTKTFEEITLPAELAGDRRWFIKENEEYKALFLEGNLIDIVLPPQVSLLVVDTAPPIRGGVDTAWKPAKLETGLEIMVPLFIAKGEQIRVDTQERKYAGKSN
jgi:elongation factor P